MVNSWFNYVFGGKTMVNSWFNYVFGVNHVNSRFNYVLGGKPWLIRGLTMFWVNHG